MTEANAAVELQYFLWAVGVVFIAATLLGVLTSSARKSIVALLLATAFTAVGMLAASRPNEIDGQTGLGVPLMWVPFFLVSWLGLVIGAKVSSEKPANR